MKTKGITIWERHAEKFVLGVAIVLFVGFAALQFIGEPNAVSTPDGNVGPAEIDGLLEQRATRIRGLISDDAESKVELPEPVSALAELRTEMDRSLSPGPTIAPLDVVIAPSIGDTAPQEVEFPVPVIKAPDRVVVVQTADALADGEVERFPDLEKLFPNPDQPHDLIVTTVVVPVDLADIRAQMQKERVDEKSKEAVKIPSGWYNDRPDNIVDVVIERQEYVDGKWQDSVTLDPIPGQFTFRSQLAAGKIDAALRDEVLGLLAVPRNQLDLIEPAFYQLKNDDLTIPSLEEDQLNDQERARQDKINGIRANLVRLEHHRDSLLDELKEKGGERHEGNVGGDDDDHGGGGGAGRRAPPGKGKRDAPGKGAGGFGAGGGSDDTGKRGDSSGKQISKRAEERLNHQIDRVERQIAGLWKDLEDLGVDPNAEGEAGPVDPETVLAKDYVAAWGHDLHVDPGRTYRYRVALRVYNPFFGKKRTLVEDQQQLAESFTIDSPASNWSDAVRVDPFLGVYITRAIPAGAQGGGPQGQATAEVYRFRRGQWHMERFTVVPGAYIGGTRQVPVPGEDRTEEVDFGTGLFVLDIVPDIDNGRGNAPMGALEASRTARVWVQNVTTGEVEERDPAKEAEDARRLDLMDRLARANDEGGQPL
jgi:hypothetical protein